MTAKPSSGFYGACGGGPYHGQMIHHGEKRMSVALLTEGRKQKRISHIEIPNPPPGVSFGHYNFDEKAQTWVWEPPA